MPTLLLLAVVFSIITHSGCSTSNLYQPGRGVFLERWIFTSRSFDLQKFSNIPNFPTCPTRAENLDKFEKNELIVSSYQHARFSAYFVSLQTGSHKFFVICDNNCKIEIEELPFGFKTILEDSGRTLLNWNSRKYSAPLILMAGFRYLLRLYMYGNGQSSDFAALGVEFPDGTENKPIDSRYLWRSKTMYSWQGLLGRRYNGITFTYSDVRMKRFYQDNADKFPSRPSYFTCLPSLVEEKTDSGDNYAMKFTGYLRLPESAQYNFRFHANEIAELRISKSNSTTLHQTAKLTDSPTLFDGGFFNHSIWYHVDAVRVEGIVTDWLTLEFSKGTNAFSSSWDGNLKNIFVEYQLPPPTPTMLNFSAISATLTVEPFLPAEDGWSPTGQFEILAFETSAGASAVVQKQAFTGPLPHVHTFTGLKNYTVYSFYAHYYGAINGTVTYNIITNSSQLRTDENVPEVPPPNIFVRSLSSKSVRAAWNALLDPDLLNGICTGFEVKYRIQNPTPKNWTSFQIDSPSTREFNPINLEEYTTYEIIVAAKTSKGSGVFSQPSTVTTNEDSPSAPPMNIIAGNISSTSIRITWDDVSYWDKNGVITGYKVYTSKIESMTNAREYSLTDQTITINDLDVWGIYYIQVSALTSIGEGPKSNATLVRTDEDIPSEAPTGVGGGFVSATKIYATWGAIPAQGRNGIISQYKITYRKKDSGEDWKSTNVSSSDFRVEIGDLQYYTLYAVKVAGVTNHGTGSFSEAVYIRTDAYGPTRPPANLNGTFVNHTSLNIVWSRVPINNRHGIILGYKLSYTDSTIKHGPWINITVLNANGSEDAIFNLTITDLKIYTPYIFKILAYTYRGEGPFSANVTVWTDDFEPDEIPKNISKENKTSTELNFTWLPMDEINGQANGKIIGYKIKYRVVDCHADRPVGCNESEVFTLMTSDAEPRVSITGLRKFTNYSITIQAVNRKGSGNFSMPIYFMTAEDKPDAPPQKIETWPSKDDRITIYWSQMPESLRNGVITGYRIFYKPLDVPLRKANRYPRSINPSGALPGEKTKDVNASTFQTEIEDLKEYSWYQIRVGALTSQGLGPTFSINGTCKQGAPLAAPSFEVYDNYGFHAIFLKWGNLSHVVARGEVLGHRVHFWPIEQNDVPVFQGKISHIDVLEPNRSLEIQGLVPFTTYGVMISAFTEGGLGVPSNHRKGETCRCPKLLNSAWLKLPPIVDSNTSISGIVPKYVDMAVSECCGNCTFGQGPSSVDWTHDASNSEAMKLQKSSLQDAAFIGTHISLPVFRENVEWTESDATLYDYVPFIPSAGMVFFKRRPSLAEVGNEGAAKVVDSLLGLYTVLLVMVLSMIVAGFVFWFLERGDNTDEFPDDFFRGTGSGIWLAFITMTTAGYGDIAPKTILGRIFAVAWTLMGIVITSLIVGHIINSLTASTVKISSTTASSGSKTEKVMASNETLMISITKLRKKTVSGNTTDAATVKNSLLSNAVTKVMIEAFEAGAMKEQLEHPDIMFDELVPVDASYGVLLAAEARRLKFCMKRYVKENSQNILKEIAQYTISFKSEESSQEQQIPVILSKDADITSMLVKYGGILLLFLVLIGLIYDAVRHMRGRKQIAIQPVETDKLFIEADKLIDNMVENLTLQTQQLEKKHTKERWRLARMDIKDLKATMPNLTIFHEDLRVEQSEETQYYKFEEEQSYDSDEETIDMPIDYKTP